MLIPTRQPTQLHYPSGFALVWEPGQCGMPWAELASPPEEIPQPILTGCSAAQCSTLPCEQKGREKGPNTGITCCKESDKKSIRNPQEIRVGWKLLQGSALARAELPTRSAALGSDTTSLNIPARFHGICPKNAAREEWGDPMFGVGADPIIHKSEVLLCGFAGFPTWADGCAKSEAALLPHVSLKRGFHYSCYFHSFVEVNVCGLNVLLEDFVKSARQCCSCLSGYYQGNIEFPYCSTTVKTLIEKGRCQTRERSNI